MTTPPGNRPLPYIGGWRGGDDGPQAGARVPASPAALGAEAGAARMADVTATCSVRNSPPGSAQVALLARVNGVSQDRVSAALSDRRLVEVHGPRMVPALVRPEDMAVFTVGGIGTDDASLRETLGKVTAGRL